MACVNFADTSSAGLAYGVQTDCGVVQTALTEMRFTSSDLQFGAETTQSEEIRSDRNVSDLIRTSTTVGGTVGFELSYENFNPFIQAALGSATALDGAGTAIDNGVAKTYFTFEDSVTAGGTTYYRQFVDCEIDTLTLNIEQGAIVNGEFGVMGRTATESTVSIDANGYTPSGTQPVYNAVSMVSAITVNGSTVGEVQSLSMEITNNMREQRAIGSQGPAGVGSGQFVVTGSMTIYFSNNTLYNIFLQDQDFSFFLELDDNSGATSGNKISFAMGKVKFGNVTRTIPGNNQDVLLVADYQAIYDSTQGGTIEIATTDAV
jgi:hypothetical protein